MRKRLLVAAFVTAALACPPPASAGKDAAAGFAGMEFYGCEQITRADLEHLLGLHPGAGLESTQKAARRLQEKLEKRHMDAHVDVADDGGRFYVTVDIVDPGQAGIPIRKLENPHRVYLSNDLPFSLFDQLMARRTQLAMEGRPVTEDFSDGFKHFSDEPCNQIGEKLKLVVPPMRKELLALLLSDPDPERRSKAIEVLNWDPHIASNCAAVMPSLDDGSEQVRVSAVRYIMPRLRMLPDNFPMAALVEAFSRQLYRPSHIDRMLALRCLTEIARDHEWAVAAIKEADEERLKQLEDTSRLASIKQPAAQLLAMFKRLHTEPVTKKPVQVNEF